MNEPTPAFAEEYAHFNQIEQKLEAALEHAESAVTDVDDSYKDSKAYSISHRHDIDPHELFQNELLMKQIERSGLIALEAREKLRKLIESPYFARVDFKPEGGETAGHYIGRFAFSDDSRVLISDWRAPVASIFYDHELGPASYEAPSGIVEGDLTKKRQFKISDRRIDYILESSINIQDDVLQRELSHTSDEKMKSIISTIQREQNRIIRDEKSGTMIIQGVAGSGKTSVALHRIAYLLYRFKKTLTAKNIMILSPNRVFADYISGVLPELGEEPIYEMGFADIAEAQLDGIMAFSPDPDPYAISDSGWHERAKYKSTAAFLREADAFLQTAGTECLVATDYTYGRFRIPKAWIERRFAAYGKYPIKKRLHEISVDILDRLETENFMEEDLPRQKAIYKTLLGMLRIKTPLALYKAFFATTGKPKMLAIRSKTLEWPDVFPFLYFVSAFDGLKESALIRHLVIDEMQDYTPTQYAVLGRLFRCDKTILGDFGQSINPFIGWSLEDMQQMYPDAKVIHLTKSYRSTLEIIAFAKRIQPHAEIEPMERHGDAPEVIACRSAASQQDEIRKRIDTFLKSGWATLGIIVKTNAEADKLYHSLKDDFPIHLISPGDDRFENGISVASVQMAKGLEFDEVLIPDADNIHYRDETDRNPLYVACTRAMHKLTLLHTGTFTRLFIDA